MDPRTKFVVVGKYGVTLKAQGDCAQNLWLETFEEAKHRVKVLVKAGAINRASRAGIMRIDEDGTLVPYYPWSDVAAADRLT